MNGFNGIRNRQNILEREDFIKNLMFSSTNIIRDSEFKEFNLRNKNLMFFLNLISDSMSSIAMLGGRNLFSSLLGKFDKVFDYFEVQKKLHNENSNDISLSRFNYLRDSIKKNEFLSLKELNRYSLLFDVKDLSSMIENYKLIKKSIINNNYFENIADELYERVFHEVYSDANCDRIFSLTNEYFALLSDYLGISIYEIKRVIKNTYSEFLRKKDESCFEDLFSNFAKSYKKINEYHVFLKFNKEFDPNLLKVLMANGNKKFTMLGKPKLRTKLASYGDISNPNKLNDILKRIDSENDNKYYIFAKINSKDVWHAMKIFRDTIIQPLIGSMTYSGIRSINSEGKYIVIEPRDQGKIIAERELYDDFFTPLSQDYPDYRDLFKRFVTDSNQSEINDMIDEAVQLLPAYNDKNNSTLNKFTNTWFALEILFKTEDNISSSLKNYASYLVADKMFSGYIYTTAIQIIKTYKGFNVITPIDVVKCFKEFDLIQEKDCCYIEWKINRIKNMVINYSDTFDKYHMESEELLLDLYFLRCRQFHGMNNSRLEIASGYMYDIVNDTILFYIDYLDIYRDLKDKKSLFNYIRNVKEIKKSFIVKDDLKFYENLIVAYNSVKKI